MWISKPSTCPTYRLHMSRAATMASTSEEKTYSIPQAELEEIYAFALNLGKECGRILLEGVEKRCGEQSGRWQGQVDKMNAVDIVTQTDLDVEAYVKTEIEKRYPDHEFIGEETYSKGSSKEYLVTNAPTWVVDPLDGTVNYTHLFPMFCVSLALCLNGQPIIGIIHAPLLNVTYHALRGSGSYQDAFSPSGTPVRTPLPLVRNPIAPLPASAPKGCIFSCEWGKDRRVVADSGLSRKVESFIAMAKEVGSETSPDPSRKTTRGGMAHGVRSLGSATMDLAYVATGAFDIWWEGGCWEWDVAAGICILQEAGGLVTTANPPENPVTDKIEEVRLGSRLYLAIRPAGESEGGGESGRQAQERVAREVWKRVRRLEYQRPGA